MSGEIINLRRIKKNNAREDSEKLAEANRLKFGRNKFEKKLSAFEQVRAKINHQGHKLDK